MRTGRNAKKLCAFILAFVMVFTNAQMSVFADAADDPNAQTQKTVQAREVSRDVGDVKDYLNSVKLYEDLDKEILYNPGSKIDREGTIGVKISFSELSGGRQFPTSGIMQYQIPDVLMINEAVNGVKIYGTFDKEKLELGTMDISTGGMITFNLKENLVKKYTNLFVTASFYAQFNGNSVNDKNSVIIDFGNDVTKTVDFDALEDVAVKKSVAPKAGADNRYEYTIVVSSTKGAKDVVVKDIPGSNIIIDENTFKLGNNKVTPTKNGDGSYTFNIPKISENGEVKITYEASLNTESLKNLNGVLDNTNNTVKANSPLSEGEVSDNAKIDYEYTMLSKKDAVVSESEGKKTATWTVTVNEKTNGTDIGGWVVKDQLDSKSGFAYDKTEPIKVTIKNSDGSVKNAELNWDKVNATDNGWTYTIPNDKNSTATYIFTYKTNVPDNEQEQALSLKNTVELKKDDNTKYADDGTLTISGTGLPPDFLVKKCEGVETDLDESGKTYYIKWTSTVNVPAGKAYTDVSFQDNKGGDNFSFLGYKIVNREPESYDELGVTSTNSNLDVTNWTMYAGTQGDWHFQIRSDQNKILLPKSKTPYTVTLTYYTKVKDVNTNQPMKNSMMIQANGLSQTSEASYEFVNNDIGIRKDGGIIEPDGKTITWNILVNTLNKDFPNKSFTISDILDKGEANVKHALKPGSLEITYGQSEWDHPNKLSKEDYSVEKAPDNSSFDITFHNLSKYNKSVYNNNKVLVSPILYIKYQTTIKDEALRKEGNLTFNNTASLQENGKNVISSSSVATINDNKVLEKTEAISPKSDNGYVATFKLDINPRGLFVNPESTETDRKTFTITDTMSDTLQLNFYKIKVVNESLQVDGKGKELELGKDYYLVYNKSERKLTITIPNADGYHFTVTYETPIKGNFGEDITYWNKAKLSVGNTEIPQYSEEFNKEFSMQQYQSTGSGGYTAPLYMTKFDSSRFQTKLPATFNLYKVAVNADGSLGAETLIRGNDTAIKTNKTDATVYVGTLWLSAPTKTEYPLEERTLYKLVETQEPEGYVAPAEPYYFVLTSDGIDLPKPKDIKYDTITATTGTSNAQISSNIQIANSKTNSGTLKITKSFEGDQLDDDQKKGIVFTVTNPATNESVSRTYDEFDADGSWTLSNIEEGLYVVTEKNAAVKGYDVETTYSVKAPETTPASTKADNATVKVVANDTSTVAVTNNYTKGDTPAKITFGVQKKIEGADDSSETFTFVLKKGNDTIQTKEITGKGTVQFDTIKYNQAGTYTYTVSETSTAPKADANGEWTYDNSKHDVTVEVTYDQSEKAFKIGNVTGLSDNNVVITNTYTKKEKPATTDVTLNVQKQVKVSADSYAAPAKDFTFELYKATADGKIDGDKSIDSVTITGKKANAGDTTVIGSASFNELTGLHVGEHYYIIKEVVDKDSDNWKCDNENHLVKVTVAQKDGELSADISGENVNANNNTLTVTNEYDKEKPIEKSISITKKNVVGDEELPGAKLKITDKDNNIVEVYIGDSTTKSPAEWTSGKEAVTIGGLEVGKVYKLVEETAPEGFEKLKSEVTFEVNKDGTVKVTASKNSVTVDGKTTEYTEAEATNDNKGIIVNDAPVVEKPTEPSKPSDESKPSTEPSSSTDPTDPSDKPDDPSKESSSSTEQSKPSSEPSSKPSDKPSSETTESSKPTDSTEPEGGSLTVIKEIEVTFDFDEGPETYNDIDATFEIGLFTDKAGKKPYGDPIKLNTVAGPAKATFEGLPAGTYYVYELDCDGNAITGNHGLAGDLGFIGYESEITVSQNKVTVKENQKVKDPVTVTNKCYIDLTSAFSYELISISGTKTWNDNNDAAGKRPKDLKLTLNNGEKEITPQNTDPNGEYYIEWDNAAGPDQWTYTISNVPQVDVTDPNWQGEDLLEYTIKEEPVDGYEAAHNGIAKGTKDTANNSNNIINADFENTYTGKTKDVTDTGSTTTPGDTTGTDTTPDATKTNDTMNFMPYLMLLIASAAVGGTTIFARRRKDSK